MKFQRVRYAVPILHGLDEVGAITSIEKNISSCRHEALFRTIITSYPWGAIVDCDGMPAVTLDNVASSEGVDLLRGPRRRLKGSVGNTQGYAGDPTGKGARSDFLVSPEFSRTTTARS